MEETRTIEKFLFGNVQERKCFGDKDVDGRIMSKLIVKKWVM
jgi:hypothetical protein